MIYTIILHRFAKEISEKEEAIMLNGATKFTRVEAGGKILLTQVCQSEELKETDHVQ